MSDSLEEPGLRLANRLGDSLKVNTKTKPTNLSEAKRSFAIQRNKLNMKNQVKVSDTAGVLDMLNSGQGRATARTVSVSDVEALAKYGEAELEEIGLAKSMRSGATAHYFPPRVANSYKYAASGTCFSVRRGTKEWYLVEVSRGNAGHCSYGGNSTRQLRLSLEQQMHCVRTNPLFRDVVAVPHDAVNPSLLVQAYTDPKVLLNVVVQAKETATS